MTSGGEKAANAPVGISEQSGLSASTATIFERTVVRAENRWQIQELERRMMNIDRLKVNWRVCVCVFKYVQVFIWLVR